MTRVRTGTLVFAMAAAVVVAISIWLDIRRGAVETMTDVPRFSGSAVVADLPSLLPPARLPARVRVTIVRDEAAATFYDSPATLDSIVSVWRAELIAIGADVRVVGPSALFAERAAQVLVIPSAPCMTLATRAAIETAAARGQGLILTGPAGTYDGGCRSLGFGLIVGLTGATRVNVLERRDMVYVVMPAGSPLAADLPPGARIELKPARQVALRIRGRDGYYADYALQPQPAEGQPLLDGALVRATRGSARIVYWGFELRDIVPRPWNRAVARLLVRNAVAWTGRMPLAWVEPWPRGRRAAAVFAQDVETQFTNARFALDSLRAAGITGTYFLTSRLALRNKRLSRALARAGEVGTHSENHRRLGGAPSQVQRARLRATQRDLSRLLGSPVAGLRPPEEQFDTSTMAAWLAADGHYLFGVNDARAAAPELLRIGNDTLVLVGRIGGDDFAIAGPGAVRDLQVMTTQFLNELTQARALGGLFLFSYHSQLIARPELVPVLARVARVTAADSSLWPATAGEVATWWRTRAALHVTTRERVPNALIVTVHNRGHRVVSYAVARIALPHARRVVGATTTRLSADTGMVRLALPPIPSGGTLTFTVRFEPHIIAPPVKPTRPQIAQPPKRAPRKHPWWQFWKR
ncbi:MAG: polysaccharide deacetylase family protein [Longimicrobiales bacterium]